MKTVKQVQQLITRANKAGLPDCVCGEPSDRIFSTPMHATLGQVYSTCGHCARVSFYDVQTLEIAARRKAKKRRDFRDL